jgi:hypothetical protein
MELNKKTKKPQKKEKIKKSENGRPPKYKSTEVELMDAKIKEYFQNCPDLRKEYIKVGDSLESIEIPTPTVAGLALYLGFVNRQSMYDYENKEGFSCILKKARTRLENIHEQRLFLQNCTGSLFWLKNHAGYKDKVEQEITGSVPVSIVEFV